MGFKKLFLIGAGLLFLAVSISTFIDPAAALRPVGLQLSDISSLNEMRANYGGMHGFLGLFLIYAALTPRLQSTGLMLVTIFSSGLVAGRIVSMMIDGMPNATILSFLAIEIFGAVTGFVLMRRFSRDFH